MDTTRDIIYRNFLLNQASFEAQNLTDGAGQGIAGCVVDDFDPDDLDVVQYSEKRAEADGMDVGNPFLGGRRIRVSGTIYGKSRALCYDLLWQLRATLNPGLAQREIPADHGYLPMYFSVPTTDPNFAGIIPMRALVMPKGIRAPLNRDQQGGQDTDPLAIPWSAVFVMRDPIFEGQTPQDVAFANTVIMGGGSAVAATDIITIPAHGFVLNDRIYFTRLVGGTGLALNTTYYVIATNLATNTFEVSTTLGGAAVNILTDYTRVEAAKYTTYTGNFLNRGTYNARLNMLIAVGAQAGTITVTAGGSNYTIAIPATTDPGYTGATGTAATDLINKTAHGLVAGDRVYITALTGGAGLALNLTYYVVNPTTNTFQVSLTSGGAAVDFTTDATVLSYTKLSYRLLRFKREKVFTVQENGIEALRRSWLTFTQNTTWPLVPAGTSGYTVTVNGAVLDPGTIDGSHMWFWESYA